MTTFAQYLAQIDSPTHRDQFAAVLQWVAQQDPQLTGVIKWNQPMFTAHGTFILVNTTLRLDPNKLFLINSCLKLRRKA